LAFGPWWLLYSGPIGPTDVHAHHAFQLVVHDGRACLADDRQQNLLGPVVVVEPDQPHAFVDERDHVLIAFVDPESTAGESLKARRAVPGQSRDLRTLSRMLASLRPENWSRAEETVHRILSSVCDSPIARPMSWWRHPAVDAALLRLPSLVEAGTLDVATLADEVGLSVSRLTHIFTDEIGVPLRSYARWMRLVNAVEFLANGQSVTAAAHAAGFADAAHFTRTFRSMFGLSPSEAVGLGTWLSP
jgi:AraC-like DNA-binding protein